MEHLRTIGVVGSYGCGKTSLLNLVEYYLANIDQLTISDPTMADEIPELFLRGRSWSAA